jgi:outer membrane receptor protein involved in Fe transport
MSDFGKKTLGITSLTPHYLYSNGNFTANVGVKVDVSTGGERTGVYFSPDVNLAYAATSQFAIFAKVDGGKELNSLAELYDDSQYMSSAYSYERSEVPFDAKLGINVGPAAGFTAEFWGGYSRANNWMMPALFEDCEFFVNATVKGFRYGARLAWQYNDVLKIHAQAEGAPTGDGKGYYKWRDNARWAINAGLTVSPIKPLDINVDWNLRTSRHLYDLTGAYTKYGTSGIAYWDKRDGALGNANSVDISARYRITDAFSVFANVENLLSKRWYITDALQNQGIHGLVGVSYKF